MLCLKVPYIKNGFAMDVINYLEKQKGPQNIDGSKYFCIHEHTSQVK